MRKHDLRQYGPSDRVFQHLTVAQLQSLIDSATNADPINRHTLTLLQDELAKRVEP